jgi:hypothetical protein
MKKKQKSSRANEVRVTIGEGGEELFAAALKSQRTQARPASRTFTAFAAPLTWGPDVTVASNIGVVTYTISYGAVGSTLVLGRVTYFKGTGGGRQVTEEFRDETTITTANAVANVVCAFKGVVTGSAVNGTITP